MTKTKKVLLVEDDPFIADIYLTKLKETGFSVETAKDGREALEKIKEKKPDLLLLDIVLPGIDGWEILKEVKKNEAWKDIKILILSNLEQKPEIEKGLRLGADKYLVKAHYTPSEVIEEVKGVLGED